MSALVDRAIEAAGLGPIAVARRAGTLGEEHRARLLSADLLALGALADRVRAEEVGGEVRIYMNEPKEKDGGTALLVVDRDASVVDLTGLDLLRQVAMVRVLGPRAANVRVNFSGCGMELAQVALGFGANELVGQIANKRGLPLAEGELLGVGKKSRLLAAHLVKQNELAGFVQRAGRTPRFVQEST